METDTDFSSSDEEPLVNSQTAKKTRAAGAFKIRDALKPPRTTSYTTKALYDQINAGQINLNPEYQRDVVWNSAKMSNIIDSMFRNYYIPPIIFSVTVKDDGTDTKVCIDGKQRLSSIKAFMDGDIPNKDLTNGKKYWFKDSQHRRASEALLDSRFTSIFQNKQVVCVEYIDLTEANERDIFRRVQEGSALTTAEKMKGNQGPWALFSRELIKTYITDANSKLLSGFGIIWDQARARDFFNIGSILYALQKYPILTNVPAGATISKFLEEGVAKGSKVPPPSKELKEILHQTLELFFIIAGDKAYNWSITSSFKYRPEGANSDDEDEDFKYRTPSQKKTRPTKAKVAPIEFVMINVLIAKHKSTLTMKQLAHAINYMRKQVRQEHVDIRANTRLSKFCLDIIYNINKDMFPDKSANAVTAENKLLSMGGTKRKRNERGSNGDDDDDDVESEEGVVTDDNRGNGRASKQTKTSSAKDVKGKGRADDVQQHAGKQTTELNRARSSSSATLVAPSSNSAPAPAYLAPAPAIPNAPATMYQVKTQPQSQLQPSTLSSNAIPYPGLHFQQQQQQQQQQMQRPPQQMQQNAPPMNYSQSQQPVHAQQQQQPQQPMIMQRPPAETQTQAHPPVSQAHGDQMYQQASVPIPNQSPAPPQPPQSYPQAPYSKPPYHSQHSNTISNPNQSNAPNVQSQYRGPYPPVPPKSSSHYPQIYAPVSGSNAVQPQSDRLAAVRAAKAENGGYNGMSQNSNWQGSAQSRDPRLTINNPRDPRLNSINSNSMPSTPITPNITNPREAQFGTPTLLQTQAPQTQPHSPLMQNMSHTLSGSKDQNRGHFNGNQNYRSGVAFSGSSNNGYSQGGQAQAAQAIQAQVQNSNPTSPSLLQRMGFNVDLEKNIKSEPN